MSPATAEQLISIGSDDCTEAADAWKQMCDALSEHRHIYLFTDFDGTLSEIAALPNDAVIDSRTQRVLKRLCGERRVTVSVLSGRSVTDVADRVGLPVICGGDHGLEIHGSDFEFVAPGADRARLEIPALCNDIRSRTQSIRGVLVQAKRFTASVHYRQVDPLRVPELFAIVQQTVDPARYEIRNGHCVFEIRPRVNWSKGDAVQWILERRHALPTQAICIGDDETDEDMFLRVPGAINVRVTMQDDIQTAARYSLRRGQVPVFLEGVLDIVHAISASHDTCP